MAILTDKNLTRYKTYLDELKTQVKLWPKYLSDAEEQLTGPVGMNFKTNYQKGKNTVQNIETVINVLKKLEKSMNTLIEDAEAFYTTSCNASRK